MKVSTVGELRARLAGLADSELVAADLWTMADLRPYVERAATAYNAAAAAVGSTKEYPAPSVGSLLNCIPAGDWASSEDELEQRLMDNLWDLIEEGGAA